MTNTTLEKWEEKTLGEIAYIKGGKRLPKGEKLSTLKTNHPYIRVTDFNDKGTVDIDNVQFITDDIYKQIKNYTISSNDLYISIAGTIGKSGIIPQELDGANLTENACKLVYKNKDILNKYIYYYTQTNIFAEQIFDKTKMAAMPKLALTRLATVKLLVPPLPEQERIVAKLDETFEAIDKVKANAGQNLTNVKELFESALNRSFTENTEGWEEKTLDSISDLKQNKAEVKNIDANTLVSFVPMEYLGINQKYFNSNQSKPIKNLIKSYTYFAENDVIMAKITPCFENGKIGIARGLMNKIGFGSSEYIVFRTNKDINSEYLYYFLNRETFRKEGAQNMLGAVGHKRVSKEFIENYPFSYPSLLEQQKIVEKLDALQEQTKQLEAIYTQNIKECDELKQSILQKAFRGEL